QDILLWTWLMYPERGMTKETLGRGIEEVTEIDIDVLERAQILKILVSREDGYEHILKNYRLLQAKEEGMWGQENLQTILLNARKKGEETRFNEEERAKYSITASGPSVRRNYGWNIEWKTNKLKANAIKFILMVHLDLFFSIKLNQLQFVHLIQQLQQLR
ncbi:MAG: hypothetical protein AABX98_00070, partial [Nanoarchaeota archaeon]